MDIGLFCRNAVVLVSVFFVATDLHFGRLDCFFSSSRYQDVDTTCLQDLAGSNVHYGYRIDGPQGWHQGHRFDSSIVLIDPYAKLVDGRRYFGDANEKSRKFLGTYDFDSLPFDWGENYKLPNIPEVTNHASD